VKELQRDDKMIMAPPQKESPRKRGTTFKRILGEPHTKVETPSESEKREGEKSPEYWVKKYSPSGTPNQRGLGI